MKIDRLIGILAILLQQEKVTAPFLRKSSKYPEERLKHDRQMSCSLCYSFFNKTERGARYEL